MFPPDTLPIQPHEEIIGAVRAKDGIPFMCQFIKGGWRGIDVYLHMSSLDRIRDAIHRHWQRDFTQAKDSGATSTVYPQAESLRLN